MAVNLNVISTFSDKGLKSATSELDKFSKATDNTIGKTSKAMAAIGVGIVGGAVAVGAGLYAIGSSFDEAFDNIRVSTGATGPALEALQNDMKAVAGSVPASFNDAGIAVAKFSSKLGLSGDPLRQMSAQVLELSRMTKTDLSGNIEAVSSVMQNFGVSATEQSSKLDVLFRASQQSGVSVADLSTQMSGAGVVLRSVGFDFNQSAALLATLGKAGIDAGDVMPALSKLLAVAAKSGKDATTVFSETFNAIKNAPNDVAAYGTALEVFGAKAGPKLATMIREGKLSYEEMTAAIAGGNESILGAGKDTQDFGEKWTVLKNRVFIALQPIASKLFDLIGNAMGSLAPVVDNVVSGVKAFFAAFNSGSGEVTSSGFAGFIENLGKTVRNIFDTIKPIIMEVVDGVKAFVAAFIDGGNDVTSSGFAGFLERVGVIARDAFDAIISGFKLLKENLDIVLPFVVSFGAAFLLVKTYMLAAAAAQKIMTIGTALFNAVMAANPIMIVALAIAALVALLFIAYKKIDVFRNAVDTAFKVIKMAISFAFNNVIKPVFTLITIYIKLVIAYYKMLWEGIKLVFSLISTAIEFAWNNVIKPIFTVITIYIKLVIAYYKMLWEAVKFVFGMITQAISFAWNSVIMPIWDLIMFGIDMLIAYYTMLWEAVKFVFGLITEAISFAWNSVIKPVWDLIMAGIDLLIAYYKFLWEGVKFAFDLIVSAIETAWGFMSGVFDSIKNGIAGVATFIGDKVEAIVGFFTSLPEKIGSVGTSIAEAIGSAFRSAYNFLADTVNDLIPDKLGFGIGPEIDLPDNPLPRFHTGGIVPGVAGANVPAMLSAGEMVLTRTQQSALLNGNVGGGGNTYTINVNVSATADKAAIGQTIVEAISSFEKRSGTGWRAA